jgi:hypothetical protein
MRRTPTRLLRREARSLSVLALSILALSVLARPILALPVLARPVARSPPLLRIASIPRRRRRGVSRTLGRHRGELEHRLIQVLRPFADKTASDETLQVAQ